MNHVLLVSALLWMCLPLYVDLVFPQQLVSEQSGKVEDFEIEFCGNFLQRRTEEVSLCFVQRNRTILVESKSSCRDLSIDTRRSLSGVVITE